MASEWGWRLSSLPDRCPRWPFSRLDLTTGELRRGSCKSIRCEVCGEREARRRAWRIARAAPNAFITLTRLPDDYQSARKAEAALLGMLRRRGYRIEWAIAHELTTGGLRHAHAVARGPYIPQRLLSTLAARSGMGRVCWIEPIAGAVGATGYALKEAFRVVGYSTKGIWDPDAHLGLNGGRLARTTRGYFK